MARRILLGLLVLTPVAILGRFVFHLDDTPLFVLAALALVPLAWVIGEATEHAAEHTGPGVGGFLNASFGNAPELIIALFAIGGNLPGVVRGSLAGSVISNLLLVFGVTQLVGPEKELNRRSLFTHLGLVAAAVGIFTLPVVLGYTGSPDRHHVVVVSIPVAAVLLCAYLVLTRRNLHEHREAHTAAPAAGAWSFALALAVLAVATVATAFVSEILVHSLDAFAKAVGATEFFIAAVIVAVVGNAAEHGGAIVIARTGKMKLASEIAISSSAQVALLVAPAVMLLSLFFAHPLALSFRWEELVAMAAATGLVAATISDGHSRRWEGALLIAGYAVVVVGFLFAGNR